MRPNLSAEPRAAVLAGLGGYVPPTVVTNEMLAQRLNTTDEWISSRTGIRERHVAAPGQATSDLAVEAGTRALKSAAGNGTPPEADLVVVATTTPDHPLPGTAPAVAARLGLGNAAAFDIAAVCSGFVYALATASAAITAGLARQALVIGAETFSTILDPNDRTTVPIFGDGAGAVLLRAGRPDEAGALGRFDLGSDGDLAELIIVPAGGSRQRSTGQPAPVEDTYFAMQGRAVFVHAVNRMAQSARTVLDATGWTGPEVDWLVGHQANARILRAVADQLEVPTDRAVMNLDRVGNTSAASIPLAMADAAERFTPGDRLLLTAFGGGLTWGSATLTWPNLEI
ncbi:beta-ketoacyl-ACP synthase III [Krasilnikovia sp. M28-CT-15]|uniref:beta-ketoacyl-ACP synthase III n=1 Tax=Krasilnikovia sp. M28-CT-15 TaxID=3373540 RepID=UPI0038778765